MSPVLPPWLVDNSCGPFSSPARGCEEPTCNEIWAVSSASSGPSLAHIGTLISSSYGATGTGFIDWTNLANSASHVLASLSNCSVQDMVPFVSFANEYSYPIVYEDGSSNVREGPNGNST